MKDKDLIRTQIDNLKVKGLSKASKKNGSEFVEDYLNHITNKSSAKIIHQTKNAGLGNSSLLKLFMNPIIIPLFFVGFVLNSFNLSAQNKPFNIEYVNSFTDSQHPHIAYWFISKDMLDLKKSLPILDKLADSSHFNMLFLTARDGISFYETEKMHNFFSTLVKHAHKRNIKIGLQLWEDRLNPIAIENTEREISEGEVILDENGSASYIGIAKHIRKGADPLKSDLLRVYAFRKKGEGVFEEESLKDITALCTFNAQKATTVDVKIKAGSGFNGYTAYVLTQHYYNFCSNHSSEAASRIIRCLQSYADIPFDGVGLDEYTNLRVCPIWEMAKLKEVFRERSYSLAMAKQYKEKYKTELERTLFDMRYAPEGKPMNRAVAINTYMDELRNGTMYVENAVYNAAKKLFGKNEFAGLHGTHHNALNGDEMWATGINWWRLPRQYGQSDERTPTATQLGMAKGYKENVLYNMYYNKSIENIAEKATYDLRFGIRTHYHAINDVQGWGAAINKTEVLAAINPIENCATLLNRFNPSLPETKLLIVFGMQALSNWYPNEKERGIMDINDKLFVEEKATEIWNAGYRNVLVPTDYIESNSLKINKEGKPELNGHTFDAILFLYPQYAKENTIRFLESFIAKGGKLMLNGIATTNFNGNDVTNRFKNIAAKAVATSYSINDIPKLGISKDSIENGCKNEDGSYTFTSYNSIKSNQPTTFSINIDGDNYTGKYIGMAAIAANKQTGLKKFAANGFTELKRNEKIILRFENPVDILLVGDKLIIADKVKKVKPID